MVSKKKQTKTVQSNLITSVDQTVKTIYIFRVLDEWVDAELLYNLN